MTCAYRRSDECSAVEEKIQVITVHNPTVFCSHHGTAFGFVGCVDLEFRALTSYSPKVPIAVAAQAQAGCLLIIL